LAIEIAQQGAQAILVSGRRQEKLAQTVQLIGAAGSTGRAIPCDVTEDAQIEAAVQNILGEEGRLDVVIANAGFGVSGSIEKLSASDWRRQFDVNVVGLASTARLTIPALKQTRGRLALIGSVAAYIGIPNSAAYNASKAAVRIIGLTLSAELRSSGVTCTTIHPGFVESEIGQVDNKGVHHPDRKDPRPAALMWTAERAAVVMARAIARRQTEFIFTGHGKIVAFLATRFPNITRPLIERLAIQGISHTPSP